MSDSPKLPVELLLEVLEILAVQEDKASRLAAAYLAQTCRWLRTLDAGKRARYFHALASKSLSEPTNPPTTNIEYETAVLEASRWPHQAPVEPLDETQGIGLPPDGFLRGNQYIALSLDQRSVQCYTIGPASAASDLLRPSSAQRETVALSRTIALPAQPLRSTVDAEAENFIALYMDRAFDGTVVQRLEVYNIETGNLALPDDQAKLIFQRNKTVWKLEMAGGFIMIRYHGHGHAAPEAAEVRHWGCMKDDASLHFPVVWSRRDKERWLSGKGFEWFCLSLLAPNFLAVHYQERNARRHDSSTTLEIHRLGATSTTHLVTIALRLPNQSASDLPIIGCGAKLAPGETGLCVVTAGNSCWILDLSLLIEILYADDSPTSPRVYGMDWTTEHGHIHTLPKGWSSHTEAAVSGWRFTRLLWYSPGWDEDSHDLPKAIQFWDASPTTHNNVEPDVLAVTLGARKVIYQKHLLHAYMNYVSDGQFSVKLHGGRVLLTCKPTFEESDAYGRTYAFYVHSWRL